MKKTYLVVLVCILAAVLFAGCKEDSKSALARDILWTNNNIAAVENKPQSPTYVMLEGDCTVTAITNYHYFNKGTKPGTIALIGEDGRKYGPWKTSGRMGQGNVKNAYWDAFPGLKLKKGKYQVVDSDEATWSHNSESGYAGFTEVRGYYK